MVPPDSGQANSSSADNADPRKTPAPKGPVFSPSELPTIEYFDPAPKPKRSKPPKLARVDLPPIAQLTPHDFQSASIVAELFERAAAASLGSTLRRGACAHLPARGRLLISGDLHDHGANFDAIVQLAELDKTPDHHVLIQEVIHGKKRINGLDFSVRALARVAALKVQYPEQVHVLMGNHELAQMIGGSILKAGISVVESFDRGMEYMYGELASAVHVAMSRFIRAMLLAVKLPSGIMCSHSLPSAARFSAFDQSVLQRVPNETDLSYNGSGYAMLWGREHQSNIAEHLAEAWGVKMFILGHQPAESGYYLETENIMILASDHERGMALPVDLAREYRMQELIDVLVPLANVRVEET